VIVKFFADIRELSGCEQENWSAPAATLHELLIGLGAKHGAAFQKRMFEGDQLSGTLIILVNGRHIEHLGGLETKLGPEDTVAIFPMVAGG
jgi:molybdopterin synthase sulfur carrier subunit